MWNPNDNLRSLKRVFDRLGHEQVNGSSGEHFDVLWSLENPFDDLRTVPNLMERLTSLQRVNHFPGISFVINKAYMATHNHFDFIPRAFEFPRMTEEFFNYSKSNPMKRFVVKSEFNRGVKLVKFDEINFESGSRKFYQEFVENPLLIDGRVFDLGVYVLITSLDPIRIYRYKSEVLSRFCPEPYYPFDPNRREKYVIDETQLTIYEMPSLGEMCSKMGFSFKTSIETHLKSRGYNIHDLWSQIDTAIVTLLLANEEKVSNRGKHLKNFFELLRFDFIIDNQFKVHLMEVNMSPNLTPMTDRFEIHALGYEQVIFNALQCAVGVSFYPLLQTSIVEDSASINLKNLLTNVKSCHDNNCNSNCNLEVCQLCACCIGQLELDNIHRSYLEHIRRGEMLRLFPSVDHFNDSEIGRMSYANKIQAKWFKSKCDFDIEWC